MNLARAQIHEQKWNDAEATLKKLTQREWPERFRDLEQQIRELQKRMKN